MMRSNQAPYVDERQTSGAVDFDAALEAFLTGGDSEALLCAAAIVINCELPLTRKHADAISNLTSAGIEIDSYSDAAHRLGVGSP